MKGNHLLVIAIMTILVACGSSSRDNNGIAADAGGDTDTAVDTDTDTDTDADTDTNTSTDDDAGTGTDGGSNIAVSITEPIQGDTFEQGAIVTFSGVVSDSNYSLDELTAVWSSDLDGDLWSGEVDASGVVTFTAGNLTTGYHTIRLDATNPGNESASEIIMIGVCAWGTPTTFDPSMKDDNIWRVFGDAFWHDDGYLEMTDDLSSKKGAIYNVVDRIAPGDVAIRFDIMTGPNVYDGADGFAMSVFNADNEDELAAIVDAGASGGGLGYAVSGGYGNLDVKAFHVEIDTWYNSLDQTHEHDDPTEENHIAVLRNGDPGEHLAWAPVPNIEDMQWHTVTVEVDGVNVKVLLDSNEIINTDVPGFQFRGGFIGFSGTTGWGHNYHRFDNLEILDECMVP
ncbi:MAG: hypothetical protein GY854_08545 [Deltaproteobacteria bacterium]|nr:hypothetical protein [Deltaproteobacteria bacterium]